MKKPICIAILYQHQPPPAKDGIIKPMKSGGYSDSGADIAYSLHTQNIKIITPVDSPDIARDYDWVFPDNEAGIRSAISKGANTFWLNTVLYQGHPIDAFYGKVWLVGQRTGDTDLYDDKFYTNNLLRNKGLPVPDALIISTANRNDYKLSFQYPVVAKPIRGRGSQGVVMVNDKIALDEILAALFSSDLYGTSVYVEPYLNGQEITLTVMPPGNYSINNIEVIKNKHWSLPAVKRFNHDHGIAPYNGLVAIVHNSAVLDEQEENTEEIILVSAQCAEAASIIDAKAPIRIDCRADDNGKYFLFDLNMKPNMTGPGRPQRSDQDSLSALAARKIGWDFNQLLQNILKQRWK